MIYKLNMGERSILISMLPDKAKKQFGLRVNEAEDALQPTEHEKKVYEFYDRIDEHGNVIGTGWNPGMALVEAEIEIGESVSDYLAGEFKKLEEAGELPRRQIPFYEKFVDQAKEA